MVEKVESDIKKGMKFKFPWQSDDGGKTKVILLSIGKCLDQWLNIKATNTSPETHRTYLSSLKGFINSLKQGELSPIRKIKTQDIKVDPAFTEGRRQYPVPEFTGTDLEPPYNSEVWSPPENPNGEPNEPPKKTAA